MIMTKVELEMIAAIKAGESGFFGNTEVQVGPLGQWSVKLYGTTIANGGAEVFRFTFAGYMTKTTRSRLNALLSGLCDTPKRVNDFGVIDAREWYVVNRH